ncbi:MAG: FAD-binding oxidoreductase, partial [Sphingomonadaceae bacterium]|nr:FAD-binding oxidoreductase [Sphingomonadaceae bacterium]
MTYDFVVVGAGIAGASVAAEVAGHGRTLILEAESAPGYHSTGRSAAFWSETYGGPLIQPLTTASFEFLSDPDPEFADRPFRRKRGALHIAARGGHAVLDDFTAEFAGGAVELEFLDREALAARVPELEKHWDRAVFEPSCADIDVAALHQAYLRAARRAGAELLCNEQVREMRRDGAHWIVRHGDKEVSTAVVINAAGAWADQLAERGGVAPLGVRPYRRTMIQLRVDPPMPENGPLVIDARGEFYFKPEAGGRLWLSPHDEIPAEAGDSAPEELDIAVAIDRFERATRWKVQAVERKWAGLRSFAADRLPVYGFDPASSGFFWCVG